MSVFIGYPSFMAYQMMKGKKGNNDGFPSIPGMIARYSALGLTNEQMATNPVWVDKTGNGHDLQMKNFAWGGMSGVGGIPTDRGKYEFTLDDYYMMAVSSGTQHAQFTFKVTGLVDGNTLSLADTSSPSNVYGKWTQDGIYTVDIDVINTDRSLYFYNGVSATRGEFTIEILPLYPGALVFDGVDDYGVCDNFPILTKEKGYTVVELRQYLFNTTDKIRSLVTNAPSSIVSRSTLTFELIGSNGKKTNFSFGRGNLVSDFEPNVFSYMTSKSYNGKTITPGDVTESNKRILVGNFSEGTKQGSNVAIWELVFLDHDATEEELTKIKDYFVKTYPWLFFDQAWTVTGKTNEDEDRATIANITGNGNDLVLSNFGFAEGSGYGLYGENYNGGRWIKSTDRADITWTSYSANITSVKVASTQLYYQSYSEQPSFTVPSYKIKVYGLKDGQTLSYRQVTPEGQQIYKISEDGIYTLPSFLFKANKNWYGFTLGKIQETCDITIEQIPEYEGYLVTDGVDDKITSSTFEMGNDWTVIGDWELINTGKNDNAGIVKFDSIVIYNYNYNYNSVLINIKNGRNILIPDQNTVNAICSDGRIYSKDWKESIYNEETESTSKNFLTIGYSGNAYTKIAFKNLAIYPTVLSREDCIKAYNYLRTLKAK